MNDEAVYRTAPATPGLLISSLISWILKFKFETIFDRLVESKYWDNFLGNIWKFGRFWAILDFLGKFVNI